MASMTSTVRAFTKGASCSRRRNRRSSSSLSTVACIVSLLAAAHGCMSCAWGFAATPLAAHSATRLRARAPRVARAAGFEAKVEVLLGPYRGGAITATGVPRADVADAAIDAALKKKKATTSKFERINFTGSGARMGLTVKIEMEARYQQGHEKASQVVPGTKMASYALELKESQPDPWKQFVTAIVSKGMGQMEQKTFPVTFPEDYPKKDFAGLTVDFTVLVKEIGETRVIEADTRPEEVQREEVASTLREQAERASRSAIEKQVKASLMESSQVDTDTKTNNVAWAKFGPESTAAMKWNFILEEVARFEDIEFEDVINFLCDEASVQYK